MPLPVFSGRIRGCYTAGITRFYPDPREVSEDVSLRPARYLLIIHQGLTLYYVSLAISNTFNKHTLKMPLIVIAALDLRR